MLGLQSLSNFIVFAQAEAGALEEPTMLQNSLDTLKIIGVLLLVFVVPFIIGKFLSSFLKMKDYGFSIGLILATIIGSSIIVSTMPLKYGPDIKGGIILQYELDKNTAEGRDVKAVDFQTALAKRLNPAGTKDIVVRALGEDMLEIIVADMNQLEIEDIKRTIQKAGILKFRIVANNFDHADLIAAARKQASSSDPQIRRSTVVRDAEGNQIAIWRNIGRSDQRDSFTGILPLAINVAGDVIRNPRTGEILQPPFARTADELWLEKWLVSQNIESIEILLAMQRRGKPYEEVSGEDLATVTTGVGQSGLEVRFTMKPSGGTKLFKLTSAAQPRDNKLSRMAIVLDGNVLSAPNLNSPIQDNGSIEGNFSAQEIDFLKRILDSGSLPAALKKEPISQEEIGAALGADTVAKGFYAAIASLIATLVFVLFYYRFSGLVACVALVMNILLIFAAMILIQQPISLAGLAGLVLTVGMSVDANVLIFERIREEIDRKSTGRMAIRNGFSRAMSTIVDANLTTLISAIVLYWAGADQIRGFAVVLVIGILISMFTAVFCSRIIFDIAERWRLASLSMTDGVGLIRRTLLGNKDVNFMSMRKIALVVSSVLLVLGIGSVFSRGKNLLDIDFNGGTSVTLTTEQPLTPDDMRKLARQSLSSGGDEENVQSNVTEVIMEPEFPRNTVYRIDTSIDKKETVIERLTKGFADSSGAELITYQVEVTNDNDSQSSTATRSPERLVAFQQGDGEQSAIGEVSSDNEMQTDEAGSGTGSADTSNESSLSVDSEGTEIATAEPSVSNETKSVLKFSISNGSEAAEINAALLVDKIVTAGERAGIELTPAQLSLMPMGDEAKVAEWTDIESSFAFDQWRVILPVSPSEADSVYEELKQEMLGSPVLLAATEIGGRVAGQMQVKAMIAIFFSLVCIVGYIWFRFQKVAYGLAAVVALAHDVLITLGFVALSHYIYKPLGFLLLEDFKVSLTMVAAFLTIIGYSLNDTIVVFDRIREVKGKSPKLTAEMVNQSVNQTLSRTVLTSATTLLTVLLLYVFGGEGIHGFAFCLLVGMIVGTYSSIFVAAPVLLWLMGFEENANTSVTRSSRQTRATV